MARIATTARYLPGVMLALLTATANASSGIVVDEAGKPIKGAAILVEWTGTALMPVQSTYKIFRCEATTTDEQGRFQYSSFSGNLNPLLAGRSATVSVVAPGYRETKKSNLSEDRYVMAPLAGTKSEQFEAVRPPQNGGGCPEERNILPFLKTLHGEYSRLAATPQEIKERDFLLHRIEVIEFGTKAADEMRQQRYLDDQRNRDKQGQTP